MDKSPIEAKNESDRLANGHTPGPWRVEANTTLVWGACNPDDASNYGMGYPVAEARQLLGHASPIARTNRPDEAVANARLIAVAPDLYVIATHPILEHLIATSDHPSVKAIFEPMRQAAIAKATMTAPQEKRYE